MENNPVLDSILDFTDKNKVPLLIGLGGAFFILLGLVLPHFTQAKKEPEITKSSSSKSESFIRVDVEGAVNAPGVHRLSPEARVQDALNEAGGLSEKADRKKIAENINLAAKLIDGEKVYFYFVGDTTSSADIPSLVNLNTSSDKELDSLPGIGLVTAQKIIASRPYTSVEQLKTKKVVSSSVYEKIKGLVSVY